MTSCRNALEELVIEEAEAQYNRLGADAKKRVDLSEVIAYALNRLPPMYATTQRGWVQQRRKAAQELGAAIAKTVRNGFLSTQSDVLRQADPIPPHELISRARSLAKLRKLFNKDYLKWKDVPEVVRDAMESGAYRRLSSDSYQSSDRRNSLLARSYAVRRRTTSTFLPNASNGFKTEKGTVEGLIRFDENFKLKLEEKNTSASKNEAPTSSGITANKISCPKCKKGTILKGKSAYGCSEYKNGCDFIFSFDDIRKKANGQTLSKELVIKILNGN